MPFKNKIISKLPKFNLKEEGKEPLKYIQESGDSLIKIIEESKFKKNTKIIIPSARKLEIALIIYLYEITLSTKALKYHLLDLDNKNKKK